MGGRSLTPSLYKRATRQNLYDKDDDGAFHHCITEHFALSLGASVLLPVTPRRTTGFNGLSVYPKYGFQSHRGALLCETMRD